MTGKRTVEVFEGADGQFYVRSVAANNRVVSTAGEGYTTKSAALEAARREYGGRARHVLAWTGAAGEKVVESLW